MDKPKISPEQFWALKIVAYLYREDKRDKDITTAETFGYMQGGITISISDLLLALENLKRSGFVTINVNKLRLTEAGKKLGAKLPQALGR